MTLEEAIQLAITRIEKLEAKSQAYEATITTIISQFQNKNLTPDQLLPMIKGLKEIFQSENPMVSENIGRIIRVVETSNPKKSPTQRGTPLTLVLEGDETL